MPTKLYFKDGRVKVEVALGRGKDKGDKRRSIADRDAKRQMERALKAEALRGRVGRGGQSGPDSAPACRVTRPGASV